MLSYLKYALIPNNMNANKGYDISPDEQYHYFIEKLASHFGEENSDIVKKTYMEELERLLSMNSEDNKSEIDNRFASSCAYKNARDSLSLRFGETSRFEKHVDKMHKSFGKKDKKKKKKK